MNFQIIRVLVLLISLISISSGYKEVPREYEEDSVSHIDYEQDQMPIKVPTVKAKRMAVYAQDPNEYENEGIRHVYNEEEQTPAQDRAWQVRPKVKRMSTSSKNRKNVHIYLNKDNKNNGKSSKGTKKTTTTTTTTTTNNPKRVEVETQTYKTPELTTRADYARNVDYVDRKPKDSVPSESYHSKQTVTPVADSQTEGSEHQEIIKEKIKIKHHHHHHHHNHVKTVVKKEPYRVEVPVEKVNLN
jgi:hypothetical protein